MFADCIDAENLTLTEQWWTASTYSLTFDFQMFYLLLHYYIREKFEDTKGVNYFLFKKTAFILI